MQIELLVEMRVQVVIRSRKLKGLENASRRKVDKEEIKVVNSWIMLVTSMVRLTN